MLYSYRTLVLTLVTLVSLFLLLRPLRLNDLSRLKHGKVLNNGSPEILNSTLGFQQVFVINLPARTDRRDAMTLAAALCEMRVTYIDGVSGDNILNKVLPADSFDKHISKGNKGSWRAHMNALKAVIQQNMTSALILEDDADWDVRIKPQLQQFAQAALVFTQPIKGSAKSTLADSSTANPANLPLDSLPPDLKPKLTPYGDNWDVLWLGHCGTDFPNAVKSPTIKAASAEGNPTSQSHHPPLLRVIIPNDDTVPSPAHLKPHPFALPDPLATAYPPHTRVVHASSGTICTQAYAVSQQGARKLLWQFGLQTFTTGWDLMLRDWCDGGYVGEGSGMGRERPVCVTVQPPLFSHHFGNGAASDIAAAGGGFVSKEKEMTPYVRLSVRLNMGRIVEGVEGDGLVDQWSDGGDSILR
ncbi:hypothetical protein B0T17DRAFT_592351 [Bombardia bombarda]|uniref:Glycosyl transferase family 25 domain-containing protein n=1 Tax=Bombardia bombarda TaxID=252184 RepID=A0AA40BVW8_9PEZI|nr:hypothetical protein B0T17DRAFT_592351 [Bombardia bombarda]